MILLVREVQLMLPHIEEKRRGKRCKSDHRVGEASKSSTVKMRS